MSSKEAMEIAANIWTQPETRHIEMDTRLAEAFANKLDELSEDGDIEIDPASDEFDPNEGSRLECLTLAINSAEVNYNDNGMLTGADADKILDAAQKYYDFVKNTATTSKQSDTKTSLNH